MRFQLNNKAFLLALQSLFLSGLMACGGGKVSVSVMPSVDQFQQHTNADVKIDILFVVDDSGSMKPEQQAVYNNFKNFIELFYDKGFDFRVAVAKTSAYGTSVRCQKINANGTLGNARNCTLTEYNSGEYIATETGLTPKEFRCGYGNDCGHNSQFQSQSELSGTEDEESNDTLKTTIGNGTPTEGTDHILASHGHYKLTKLQMIEKFKKNILVGLGGTGDERALESAETVIRNMKRFYTSTDTQFPRPNAHLAVIHVGDEGDGPVPGDSGTAIRTLNKDTVGTRLFGSNKGALKTSSSSCEYNESPVIICKSTWGSLRSSTINNDVWPEIYEPIVLVEQENYVMVDHLASVESYLDALRKHEPTATVSVHAIQDLPAKQYIPDFLPSTAFDSSGYNSISNHVGYYQAYMAYKSGGLILSKDANFGASLSALGDHISSLASSFPLSETLDSNAIMTLEVYVEGVNGNRALPQSAQNGYTYDAINNRINFHGSMIPPQGALIGLSYTSSKLSP